MDEAGRSRRSLLERIQDNALAVQVVGTLSAGAIAAVVAIAFDLADERAFWIVLTGIAVLVSGGLAWLLRRKPHVAPASGDPRVAAEPPRGTRFLGIAVGRMHTSYGLLTVSGHGRGAVPAQRQLHVEPAEKVDVDITTGVFGPLYAALAPRIRGLLQAEERVDGIGVGLPGQVDPVQRSLLEGPGGVGMGEMVAMNLAEALHAHGCNLAALGVEPRASAHQAKSTVEQRILVDNDARCAVRLLQSEVLSDPAWRNYVYVHVGGGLGTGIVLEKVIYYGTRGTSGESGHMTLDLSADQALVRPKTTFEPDPAGHRIPTGDDAVALRDPVETELIPEHCRCGRAGVHWEALAEGRGLVSLARQIDDDRAGELARAAGRNGAPYLTARDVGIAIAHVDGARPERPAPDEMVRVLEPQEMRAYVQAVVRVYARFVALGLANLANVLNLDHIVLGGGVMDGLYDVRTFRRELRDGMERYTLETCRRALAPAESRGKMHYDYEDDAPGRSWQGAALLFHDASYATFRERLK